MYNKHFGLEAAPFRVTPDTRHFFGGGRRAEILDTLIYAISHGEGIVKVSGEIGTGKTMLCHMLQQHLPGNIETVYLANPGLDRHEIITAIAMELGLEPPPGAARLEVEQQLRNHLLQAHQQGRQVVVFVEEAQRMPLATLEEIRLLSNLETSQAKLLQLVLFGQPELDQLLEKREIRQLRDRISHSFELAPLSSAEVRDYVRFRLHSAGYTGNELFTPLAYRQLAWSSHGLIRRLHMLADKALLAAFAVGSTRVQWHHVRRAASDDRHPARVLHWLPEGMAPGLVSGLLLAVASVPLLDQISQSPPASVNQQLGTITRQTIDEARRRALQMKPAAGGIPLASHRLPVSRDWLAHGGGKYTIQLLLSENDDLTKVEEVLSSRPYYDLLPDLYLYRSRVNGSRHWNLLYGEFASKSKALAALADLPERIQQQQPFLRSLTRLRKLLRQNKRSVPGDHQG